MLINLLIINEITNTPITSPTPAGIRIERLKSRDGYEQNSQDDLEKNTRKIIDLCDFTVDNSGSFKDLTKEVTDFVVKNGL